MKVLQALREQARAENEATLAKNEAAIDRLLASNERFRAEIGNSINSINRRMTGLITLATAILGVLIAVLQFFG